MSDIDYHSIYTQFITEKCKGVRPPAIITKGFLGKIPVPANRFNVYQIVSSNISPEVLKAIELNRSHPFVQSYTIIKSKTTTVPEDIQVIEFSSTNSITFSDIVLKMDPSTINVLLYDSVVIDYTWSECLGNITTGTLGIFSSKTFIRGVPLDVKVYNDSSQYIYGIDNFNGFAFFGRPQLDLGYYINVFGSRHMLIKKFYQSKYNIVNLAYVCPCYMFEENSDYSQSDTYVNVPSFSVVIVQPQSDVINSTLIIDEKDIFKERDDRPIDVPIHFTDLQISLDSFLPFVKRLDLAELEHNLKITFYNQHRNDFEQKHKFILEDQMRMQKDFELRMQETRIAQMEKLEEEYRVKSKQLVTKYASIEQQLSSEVEAIRTKRLKELEEKLEEETDIARAKKAVELEAETKTLYDALETQYAAAHKERQAALLQYETFERERIDREISDLYSKKYTDLNTRIESKRKELEASTDKIREKIELKIEEETRAKFITKFNDEYIRSMAKVTQTIEKRKEELFSLLEKEIDAFKQTRKTEVDKWEQAAKQKLKDSLECHEHSRKKEIATMVQQYYQSQMKGIHLKIENDYAEEKHKKLKLIDKELDIIRLNGIKHNTEKLEEMLHLEMKKIEIDVETLRMKRFAEIENEITQRKAEFEIERSHMIQELEAYEQRLRNEIDQRLHEFETNEMSKRITEFETAITDTLQAKTALKEAEIEKEITQKRLKVETEFASKINDLDKQFIQRQNEMLSQLEKLRTEQNERVKKHEQDFTDQVKKQEEIIRNSIVQTRLLYIEQECAKARERRANELADEFETHIAEFKTSIDDMKQTIVNQNNEEIRNMKEKKRQEFDAWMQTEQEKYSLQMKSKMLEMESELNELYTLKKKEYTDTFTQEITEIEKGRIQFHAREQARLEKELSEFKSKCTHEIQTELSSAKKQQYDSMYRELEKIKQDKIKELEQQIETQYRTVLQHKLKEIDTLIEPKINERINIELTRRKQHVDEDVQKYKQQQIDTIDKERRLKLESIASEINSERLKNKNQILADCEDFRNAKMKEIENEMIALKQKHIDDIHKKGKEELEEYERKRKEKVKEMEKLVMGLYS